MHRRLVCYLVAVSIALAGGLFPGKAVAFHSDQQHLIDQTGYSLNKGEWILGAFRFGYAFFDFLQLETYTLPWLLKAPNFTLKSTVWSNDLWAVALRVHFTHVDFEKVNWVDVPARLNIIPLEAAASYRITPDFKVSLALQYNQILTEGEYDEAELKGAVANTNSQAVMTLELRLHRRWALTLRGRMLLAMDTSGNARTIRQVDPYTTVTIYAKSDLNLQNLAFPKVWSVVPGVAYSGSVFAFEFGLGYGNYNVPGVNFVVPDKSIVPEFDLYWRW